MQCQTRCLVQSIQFIFIGRRKIVIAGFDDDVAGSAGAASSAGVLKLNAKVDGDVQQGLGLPMFIVGKLAGFKLDSLAEIVKVTLGTPSSWHTG